MNAYLFEDLYNYLGQPLWFWPVVLTLLLLVIVAGASVSEDV